MLRFEASAVIGRESFHRTSDDGAVLSCVVERVMNRPFMLQSSEGHTQQRLTAPELVLSHRQLTHCDEWSSRIPVPAVDGVFLLQFLTYFPHLLHY